MKKYRILFFSFLSVFFTSCHDFKEIGFSGIENVQLTKISKEGAEAEITARIKNPNNTAFVIYPTTLEVTLNGMNAGQTNLTGRIRIKAHSEQSYIFQVKSDFSKLDLKDLPRLISLSMSKNVKVVLKGNLKVGKLFVKRSYPVELNESVSFHKN